MSSTEQKEETELMLKIGKLQQIKDENKRFQDAKKYFECEKFSVSDNSKDKNQYRSRNRSKSEPDHKNDDDHNVELFSNNSRNKIDFENENNLCRSLDSLNSKNRKAAKKITNAMYLQPLVMYESESKKIVSENIDMDENLEEEPFQLLDYQTESQKALRRKEINKIRKELFDTENSLQINILPKPMSHHTKFNFQ